MLYMNEMIGLLKYYNSFTPGHDNASSLRYHSFGTEEIYVIAKRLTSILLCEHFVFALSVLSFLIVSRVNAF